MVGEFLELQGMMGMYYVCYDGEVDDVVFVCVEYYQLCFFGDVLLIMLVLIVVVFVDKFEMIVGIWGIGFVLIGEKDLFVLCCYVFGVLCLLFEKQLLFDFVLLLCMVYVCFNGVLGVVELIDVIFVFFMDCLCGLLCECGYLVGEIDVVLSLNLMCIDDFVVCFDVVCEFMCFVEVEVFVAVNKWILNILKKLEGGVNGVVQLMLFVEVVEKVLYEQFVVVMLYVQLQFEVCVYMGVLLVFVVLCVLVDMFFNDVMVNVEDLVLCVNCFVLLFVLYQQMNCVVDILKFVV